MKISYKEEILADQKISPSKIIELLLKTRNITDSDAFFTPPSPLNFDMKDFGYSKEVKKTIEILKEIYANKRMVVVYTDYDADGITGGAILWETLHLLGFKVMPYVPNRHTEGYGFSTNGIDKIKKEYDPALIISVDHGITAKEKVTYAKSIGIPVIITDHHLKPEHIPDDAEAIFHIPQLSGSGVSYFFSKEIFNVFSVETRLIASLRERLKHNFEHDYISLAAIGTIADLVPLVGPSRSIVKYGLESCIHTERRGLKQIFKEAGIEGKKITPYEVGFIIAPRINAIGRLQHAMDALRLLCTTSSDKAQELAGKMGDRNRERQDLVKEAVAEAKEMVKKMGKIPNIITLISDHWNEGIIGLIASKITEENYRPTIVMTKSDGFLKASARSIPSFHITNFLRELKEQYLVDVGGHSGAAGFTIESTKLKGFIAEVQKKAGKIFTPKDLEKVVEADIKLSVSMINLSLVNSLEKLQPFGVGNPQPIFYSEVVLLDAKLFGKQNEHLRLYVKDPEKNMYPLEIIAFGKGQLFNSLATGIKLSIVYAAEIDRWGGNEKVRGRLLQIV